MGARENVKIARLQLKNDSASNTRFLARGRPNLFRKAAWQDWPRS